MANVKFDYKNVATLQQYLDPHGNRDTRRS